MSTKIVASKLQNSLFALSNIYDNAGSYYSCEIKRQRRQVLSWSTKIPCKTTRLQQSNGSSFNHISTRLGCTFISPRLYITLQSLVGTGLGLFQKGKEAFLSFPPFFHPLNFLFRCQCLIVNVIKRVSDSFPELINGKVI